MRNKIIPFVWLWWWWWCLLLLLQQHSVAVGFMISSSTTNHPWSTSTTSLRRLQQQSSLLMQHRNDERTDEEQQQQQQVVTYYSPNVALDETTLINRRRHDRNDDDNVELPSAATTTSTATTVVSNNEYSFFDEAIIYVRAGSGGQGASTYRKAGGRQNGPPDGGNGGKGGNVVLVVDESLNTLAGLTNAWRPNAFGGSGAATTVTATGGTSYRRSGTSSNPMERTRPKSFRAENGADGARQFKNGRFGKDVFIRVPPGTIVQEEIELETEDGKKRTSRLVDVGTLTLDEEPSLTVARGGEGGEGSGVAGSKASGRGVRRPRVPPQGGERKRLKLTLKIVADVALVGVPNAGKSTFLAAVTRAKPKIANYPFTTVVPNLGVWIPPNEFDDHNDDGGTHSQGSGSSGLVLCDVPGLVAGAAHGVGLGHAFLRHVERCHVILHLIDATSNDPIADFEMLNHEIQTYGSGQLARMPQVVVVNKVDAYAAGSGEEWEKGLETRLSRDELETKLKATMAHSRLIWMSAKEKDGVDELMMKMAGFVRKVKDAK